MKISIFLLLTILSSASLGSELGKIEKFAVAMIDIVRKNNVTEFKKIECVKKPCGNIGVNLIFGKNESSTRFKEIMSQSDVSFKVFGPYTADPDYPNSTYSIVFYSESKSPFGGEDQPQTLNTFSR